MSAAKEAERNRRQVKGDVSEKKRYAVTIPVAGSVIVYVEAEDEEAAELAAFEQQDWHIETGETTEAGEFDSFRSIVRGNVCSAPCWELSVEEER